MNGTYLKTVLMGRLGRDPEVQLTANGNKVVKLSVATNHPGPKGSDGQRTEETEWTQVVLFGRNADFAERYLTKGRKVFVEGRNKTSKWQDKDSGQDRFKTEVLADMVQGVDSPAPTQNDGQTQQSTGDAYVGNRQGTSNQESPVREATWDDFEDESIPL